MADDRTLVLLISGQRAGLVNVGNDRYQLAYDREWQVSPRATPLSLSMPLAQRVHGDAVVRPFLWGLLPDNELVLERWGKDYHVSPRNPFALLRHVGEDCAGAAQFARPERADALLANAGTVVWLTDGDVEQRLCWRAPRFDLRRCTTSRARWITRACTSRS